MPYIQSNDDYNNKRIRCFGVQFKNIRGFLFWFNQVVQVMHLALLYDYYISTDEVEMY